MSGATFTAISPARRKSQRGSTVILFTMLCSLLLIPVAGLAIDSAVVYLMKAKLSAAVDASALATARGLSVGTSLPAQTAAATATGNSYFAANLPAGTMGATVVGGVPTITVVANANNTLVATVQATITVPLTLMRILHFNTATLSATGQASRRVSNIILVLDRSYSMVLANACSTLVSSAQQFVNDFVDGRDTLDLITFQATANEDYAATTYFKSSSTPMTSKIAQLQCTGYTNTAEALNLAWIKLQNLKQPLANNVIVLFTDGKADTITGKFPIRTSTTTEQRYNWKSLYQQNQSTVPVGKSPCTQTFIAGVVINAPGGETAANDTGGIYADTAEAINWQSQYQYSGPYYPYPDGPAVSGTGCNYTSTSTYSYPTNTLSVRNDIAFLPTTDYNPAHASLIGYATQSSDYYPAGTPYGNQLRIDTVQSVNDAALSDTDNIAAMIRADSTYKPTIYTIGLGGTPYQQIDTQLLERVANDPRSTSYNSSQQTGLYIYCTQAGLTSAFQQIASQILRLSK